MCPFAISLSCMMCKVICFHTGICQIQPQSSQRDQISQAPPQRQRCNPASLCASHRCCGSTSCSWTASRTLWRITRKSPISQSPRCIDSSTLLTLRMNPLCSVNVIWNVCVNFSPNDARRCESCGHARGAALHGFIRSAKTPCRIIRIYRSSDNKSRVGCVSVRAARRCW